MVQNLCLHYSTTALIPIEGIGTTEDVDLRAGPVKGATMGFKKFLIEQPQSHD